MDNEKIPPQRAIPMILRAAADRGIEVDERAIALVEMSKDLIAERGIQSIDIFAVGINDDGSRSMRREANVEFSQAGMSAWLVASINEMTAAGCCAHWYGWIIHPSLKESSP